MFLTLSGQVVVAQDNVIDRVEWVVGDKSILRSDIEEAIRWYAESASQDDMLSVESLERIRDYYALPEHQNLRYTSLAQAVLEKLNNKK